MKRSFVFILALAAGMSFAQETNTWRWGLQLGLNGNESKFTSGSANANARFHHNSHGTGMLNVVGRYDLNNHWMIEGGMGLNSLGFSDAIAENYSFINPGKRFTNVETTVGLAELPLMVSYKFNPNCKNWKWFISAGGAAVFVADVNKYSEAVKGNDGPSNVVYLSSTTTGNKGGYLNLRFAAGREKVYQSGRIFSWAFVWNAGLSEMASNTVNYTIDNQAYSHTFSNHGHFFGFRMAYYFKPLNSIAKVNTNTISK